MSENIIIMTKYPPSIKPMVNEEYENHMKKNRITMARKKSSFVENNRKKIMEEKSKISMAEFMQENNKKFLEIETKNREKELLEIDEEIENITEELDISVKELNITIQKVKKIISDITKN